MAPASMAAVGMNRALVSPGSRSRRPRKSAMIRWFSNPDEVNKILRI